MAVTTGRELFVRHAKRDGRSVAVMRAMCASVIVLLEFQLALVLPAFPHQANPGNKGMRLRNFVARFQIFALVLEREQLSAAIRPCRLDGDIGGPRQHARTGADTKPRRHVVFKDLDVERACAKGEAPRLLAMIVTLSVAVPVMMPAG